MSENYFCRQRTAKAAKCGVTRLECEYSIFVHFYCVHTGD